MSASTAWAAGWVSILIVSLSCACPACRLLLIEMRYAQICDKENNGVMVLSDAFKMGVWSLMRAYPKAGKNASQQGKYSAGFQVPLSFLRDSVSSTVSVKKSKILTQS